MGQENQDKDAIKNSIKESIKKKIKEELKKELLQEIYEELKLEEEDLGKEVAASLSSKVEHSADIKIPETVQKAIPKKKKSEIEITVKAVLKIASHALKYANKKIPKEDWVEVIGLLAGKEVGGKYLYIEDAYPMGHGNAIYAEIKDYKNYVRAFNDIKKKKMFICGWYHSHPSYSPFMSGEDIGTQERYQKLWEKSVALVIDPYEIDGTSTGFEIYKADLKTRKWFSLPYSIKGDLDIKMLPEILNFINPIVDGKAIYLEYDEE